MNVYLLGIFALAVVVYTSGCDRKPVEREPTAESVNLEIVELDISNGVVADREMREAIAKAEAEEARIIAEAVALQESLHAMALRQEEPDGTEQATVVEEVASVVPSVEPVMEPDEQPVPERMGRYTTKYDKEFQKWTKHYLPFWDWRWLKAQCYQESLLKPDAVSPVGAQGLCQFMPGTWREISPRVGLSGVSPFVPEANIRAAAYYNSTLWNQWSSPRPDGDRRKLVFACYNAGIGNILKAQRLCSGALLYDDIIECLPDVTGHHSKETITYNIRIEQWYQELRWLH